MSPLAGFGKIADFGYRKHYYALTYDKLGGQPTLMHTHGSFFLPVGFERKPQPHVRDYYNLFERARTERAMDLDVARRIGDEIILRLTQRPGCGLGELLAAQGYENADFSLGPYLASFRRDATLRNLDWSEFRSLVRDMRALPLLR